MVKHAWLAKIHNNHQSFPSQTIYTVHAKSDTKLIHSHYISNAADKWRPNNVNLQQLKWSKIGNIWYNWYTVVSQISKKQEYFISMNVQGTYVLLALP